MTNLMNLTDIIAWVGPLDYKVQELSYRQQIARQMRTRYAEGIYRHNLILHRDLEI